MSADKQCPAQGCTTMIPPDWMMCPIHRVRVSTKTERELSRTFMAWVRGESVAPYLDARDKAIAEAGR